MAVEKSITRGNILSIVTTVVSFGGLVVSGILFITEIKQEVATKDREHDTKIERLERDVGFLRNDHDTIIEVRQDVKAIRAILDRLDRRGTMGSP